MTSWVAIFGRACRGKLCEAEADRSLLLAPLALAALHEEGPREDQGADRSKSGGDAVGGRDRRPQPVLRGWGNYFRTGNASDKFVELDRHVAWRLKRLLKKQRGRNLRAGQASKWTPAWSHDQGLHQLMGTIRYPKTA